jgi:hypothetical protein
MFLLTASEVVLGTAIIMGLSALATVLLRICSRPAYVRNSQNISTIPNEFGRMGTRVSLTSLQQRVMSKLRDRPPRYETRHNYEYQRREASTRITVLNPAATTECAFNIPPPAYEPNDNSSVRIFQFRPQLFQLRYFLLGRYTNFLPLTLLPFKKTVGEFQILRFRTRTIRREARTGMRKM